MAVYEGWEVQDDDTFFPTMISNGFPITGENAYEKHEILLNNCDLDPSKFRTAVDIGAHVGIWSKFLSGKFNDVVSFEPSASNCEYFKKNTTGLSNITLHQVALHDKVLDSPFGDSTKTHSRDNTLNIPEAALSIRQLQTGNHGSYRLINDEDSIITDPNPLGVTEETISLKNLDSYGLLDVDLIQIHIKGNEGPVLVGAKDTIETFRPVIIYQCYENQTNLYGYSVSVIDSIFEELNYTIEDNSSVFSAWNVEYKIAKPN